MSLFTVIMVGAFCFVLGIVAFGAYNTIRELFTNDLDVEMDQWYIDSFSFDSPKPAYDEVDELIYSLYEDEK